MERAQTASMLEEKPLLMLMDGHALVHRAWHAIRQPLTVRSTGEEVKAVFGFLNTFFKSVADWKPTHCIITFDLPVPTFRHLRYKEYKAHRPPTPPELRAQFRHVREFMQAFGLPIMEAEGFEADDVLGTLCRQAEEQELDTVVLTGDSDTLQLVSPWVRVVMSYAVQNRQVYDEAAVRERYNGLGPDAVADIKALQGDSSDNIPGVPGIGAKTAIKLVTSFGGIDGIYERIDEVTPPRAQSALRENEEGAREAKVLTTIVRDAPVKLDTEAAAFWTFDRNEVVELLRKLEFFTMVDRIPSRDGGPVAAEEPAGAPARSDAEYTIVDTEEALEALAKELSTAEGFAFDTETTSKDAMAARLVGLSFSNDTGKSWYVPVGHDEDGQLPMDRVLERLGPILADDSVPKVAHNANYDITVLSNHGVEVNNLAFDTMLAAHISGRKAIGLKALALECLNEEMTPISELIGTGRKQITMAQVSVEKAAPYAAADADVTRRLLPIMRREVEESGGTDVFDTVEMPLVEVLVRMHRSGVALDVGLLEQMAEELGAQLSQIEAGMYDLIGHQFNLNSSQQLGGVLFEELRLPPTKRTQKGFSTDAQALDSLKQRLDSGDAEDVDPRAYEVLGSVLEYRQLSKIKSTYVDALPALVNESTGRVHTSYNQSGSATGRISSNDPNVQNIPVRTELGRRVRKAFIAEHAPEWLLLAADYSQIELRILAHLSRDKGLLEAFARGEDIHSATASSVYGVTPLEVTADMRRIAKIMNFGVVYGLSAFGIRQQTGLSAEEGKTFIETYFGKYPGIRDYIDSTKRQVHQDGYVETLLGRRRYIPEIRATNHQVRAAGERMAINMPIQGTAADIIKLAMLSIHRRMEDQGVRSMMLIQVHDELIFEVHKEELEQMKDMVRELMPAAMDLAVPLNVELKVGETWGDME